MKHSINARQAFDLLVHDGPRYYFEMESRAGVEAHPDHELWRTPGARFCVHMEPQPTGGNIRSASECATDLIDRIVAFKALFLSEQPAGTPFPGYGIRFAGVGGAYAYVDLTGLLPFASHHRLDSLPTYLNAFAYTPNAQAGTVTTAGHSPTSLTFKVTGDAANRPDHGYVNNMVTFSATTPTVALREQSRKVTAWLSDVVTVESAWPGGATPTDGDMCSFKSGNLQSCLRFTNARESLGQWTVYFFEAIENNWPPGLEPPEELAATVENFGTEVVAAWRPEFPAFADYLAAEAFTLEAARDKLVPGYSLTAWFENWGKKLNGSAIDLSAAPVGVNQYSPTNQDYRSVSFGAFAVGLAWTWQLAFVNRMKRTWPNCRFVQYQLHQGNQRSPVRTQPGEVFYHGEPWPPDVGHAHDEYATIFPFSFRPSVTTFEGKVEDGLSTTQFKVMSDLPFNTVSNWGIDTRDHLAFTPATGTASLQSAAAIITGYNPGLYLVTCTTLPATPDNEDKFEGYVELDAYWDDWLQQGIRWDIWPAFEALYGHTGTFDERYRQTCISWVTEIAQRMTAAWPDHDVTPFMQRWGENRGPMLLEGKWIYPDPPVYTVPGIQPRGDWTIMLSNMMDAGVTRTMIFEPDQEYTAQLDAWVEIFTGIRAHYHSQRDRLELLAPHQRNRHWRHNRRLWRH